MSVVVFEDPCPKPGQSIQELIDRILGKNGKKETHQDSFI